MRGAAKLTATLVALLGASCLPFQEPTPTATPPPGWYNDVRELFVDEAAFPEGWEAWLYLEPTLDPRANRAHREFGRRDVSEMATQDIWRSYTISSARQGYEELRGTQFEPSRPLPEGEIFVPFEPPEEISFESQVADEFYLACGWWTWPYCQVVARYRNYEVLLRLDHEAERDGRHTGGLTYSEIETVIRAMDLKFEEAFESFATATP